MSNEITKSKLIQNMTMYLELVTKGKGKYYLDKSFKAVIGVSQPSMCSTDDEVVGYIFQQVKNIKKTKEIQEIGQKKWRDLVVAVGEYFDKNKIKPQPKLYPALMRALVLNSEICTSKNPLEAILTKEGRLSSEEFAILKKSLALLAHEKSFIELYCQYFARWTATEQFGEKRDQYDPAQKMRFKDKVSKGPTPLESELFRMRFTSLLKKQKEAQGNTKEQLKQIYELTKEKHKAFRSHAKSALYAHCVNLSHAECERLVSDHQEVFNVVPIINETNETIHSQMITYFFEWGARTVNYEREKAKLTPIEKLNGVAKSLHQRFYEEFTKLYQRYKKDFPARCELYEQCLKKVEEYAAAHQIKELVESVGEKLPPISLTLKKFQEPLIDASDYISEAGQWLQEFQQKDSQIPSNEEKKEEKKEAKQEVVSDDENEESVEYAEEPKEESEQKASVKKEPPPLPWKRTSRITNWFDPKLVEQNLSRPKYKGKNHANIKKAHTFGLIIDYIADAIAIRGRYRHKIKTDKFYKSLTIGADINGERRVITYGFNEVSGVLEHRCVSKAKQVAQIQKQLDESYEEFDWPPLIPSAESRALLAKIGPRLCQIRAPDGSRIVKVREDSLTISDPKNNTTTDVMNPRGLKALEKLLQRDCFKSYF